MAIDFKPHSKQFLANKYLFDKTTNEILYGGCMAGGKSYFAAVALILYCLHYPSCRCLLGRAELKTLKRTTLKTFFDICKAWKITDQFNFNKTENIITFNNGSEIILQDLKLTPSDPDFVSLGSSEYTMVVLDECGEIPENAYRVLKGRIRYKLKEFGLIPKMLLCSNPSKNWLYSEFYKPYTENDLPITRKFIQAVPKDNPNNDQSYLDTLTPENLGMPYYNLLVLGNWEYASTDFDLFEHTSLQNCFYHLSPKIKPTKYITIDPASSGKDSTVISVWDGYNCIKIIKLEKADTNVIVNKVRELMQTFTVRISNVIVDRVGVGTGVFDLLKGCVGFVAHNKPFKAEPFQNLKAQMFFKFAQMVNSGMVGIGATEYREDIILQLEAHKQFNTDKDGKFQVTPKDVIKKQLGVSPDFADSLMMRAYYEYQNNSLPVFY
jgi:phage terminase large subunit